MWLREKLKAGAKLEDFAVQRELLEGFPEQNKQAATQVKVMDAASFPANDLHDAADDPRPPRARNGPLADGRALENQSGHHESHFSRGVQRAP